MDDDHAQGAQEARPMLYARNPFKKVPDEDWPKIRALAEAGEDYKVIGEKFGITHHTVRKRATEEQWVTPRRLARGAKGQLATNDPATIVADLWKQRGESSREMMFQGMNKSLQRFMAMAPVPASFAEAATAHKLLKEAIDPNADKENGGPGISISILAAGGFCPKPAHTVDV